MTAAERKRTWVRPTARPITTTASRADLQDVPAQNGFSITGT